MSITILKMVSGKDSNIKTIISAVKKGFEDSMDDDLNISGALAAVFDLIKEVNRGLDQQEVGLEGAKNALKLINELDEVTGLFGDAPDAEVPEQILQLVSQRQEARRNKDFSKADSIRDEMLDLGWILEDPADGPRVKKA